MEQNQKKRDEQKAEKDDLQEKPEDCNKQRSILSFFKPKHSSKKTSTIESKSNNDTAKIAAKEKHLDEKSSRSDQGSIWRTDAKSNKQGKAEKGYDVDVLKLDKVVNGRCTVETSSKKESTKEECTKSKFDKEVECGTVGLEDTEKNFSGLDKIEVGNRKLIKKVADTNKDNIEKKEIVPKKKGKNKKSWTLTLGLNPKKCAKFFDVRSDYNEKGSTSLACGKEIVNDAVIDSVSSNVCLANENRKGSGVEIFNMSKSREQASAVREDNFEGDNTCQVDNSTDTEQSYCEERDCNLDLDHRPESRVDTDISDVDSGETNELNKVSVEEESSVRDNYDTDRMPVDHGKAMVQSFRVHSEAENVHEASVAEGIKAVSEKRKALDDELETAGADERVIPVRKNLTEADASSHGRADKDKSETETEDISLLKEEDSKDKVVTEQLRREIETKNMDTVKESETNARVCLVESVKDIYNHSLKDDQENETASYDNFVVKHRKTDIKDGNDCEMQSNSRQAEAKLKTTTATCQDENTDQANAIAENSQNYNEIKAQRNSYNVEENSREKITFNNGDLSNANLALESFDNTYCNMESERNVIDNDSYQKIDTEKYGESKIQIAHLLEEEMSEEANEFQKSKADIMYHEADVSTSSSENGDLQDKVNKEIRNKNMEIENDGKSEVKIDHSPGKIEFEEPAEFRNVEGYVADHNARENDNSYQSLQRNSRSNEADTHQETRIPKRGNNKMQLDHEEVREKSEESVKFEIVKCDHLDGKAKESASDHVSFKWNSKSGNNLEMEVDHTDDEPSSNRPSWSKGANITGLGKDISECLEELKNVGGKKDTYQEQQLFKGINASSPDVVTESQTVNSDTHKSIKRDDTDCKDQSISEGPICSLNYEEDQEKNEKSVEKDTQSACPTFMKAFHRAQTVKPVEDALPEIPTPLPKVSHITQTSEEEKDWLNTIYSARKDKEYMKQNEEYFHSSELVFKSAEGLRGILNFTEVKSMDVDRPANICQLSIEKCLETISKENPGFPVRKVFEQYLACQKKILEQCVAKAEAAKSTVKSLWEKQLTSDFVKTDIKSLETESDITTTKEEAQPKNDIRKLFGTQSKKLSEKSERNASEESSGNYTPGSDVKKKKAGENWDKRHTEKSELSNIDSEPISLAKKQKLKKRKSKASEDETVDPVDILEVCEQKSMEKPQQGIENAFKRGRPRKMNTDQSSSDQEDNLEVQSHYKSERRDRNDKSSKNATKKTCDGKKKKDGDTVESSVLVGSDDSDNMLENSGRSSSKKAKKKESKVSSGYPAISEAFGKSKKKKTVKEVEKHNISLDHSVTETDGEGKRTGSAKLNNVKKVRGTDQPTADDVNYAFGKGEIKKKERKAEQNSGNFDNNDNNVTIDGDEKGEESSCSKADKAEKKGKKVEPTCNAVTKAFDRAGKNKVNDIIVKGVDKDLNYLTVMEDIDNSGNKKQKSDKFATGAAKHKKMNVRKSDTETIANDVVSPTQRSSTRLKKDNIIAHDASDNETGVKEAEKSIHCRKGGRVLRNREKTQEKVIESLRTDVPTPDKTATAHKPSNNFDIRTLFGKPKSSDAVTITGEDKAVSVLSEKGLADSDGYKSEMILVKDSDTCEERPDSTQDDTVTHKEVKQHSTRTGMKSIFSYFGGSSRIPEEENTTEYVRVHDNSIDTKIAEEIESEYKASKNDLFDNVPETVMTTDAEITSTDEEENVSVAFVDEDKIRTVIHKKETRKKRKSSKSKSKGNLKDECPDYALMTENTGRKRKRNLSETGLSLKDTKELVVEDIIVKLEDVSPTLKRLKPSVSDDFSHETGKEPIKSFDLSETSEDPNKYVKLRPRRDSTKQELESQETRTATGTWAGMITMASKCKTQDNEDDGSNTIGKSGNSLDVKIKEEANVDIENVQKMKGNIADKETEEHTDTNVIKDKIFESEEGFSNRRSTRSKKKTMLINDQTSTPEKNKRVAVTNKISEVELDKKTIKGSIDDTEEKIEIGRKTRSKTKTGLLKGQDCIPESSQKIGSDDKVSEVEGATKTTQREPHESDEEVGVKTRTGSKKKTRLIKDEDSTPVKIVADVETNTKHSERRLSKRKRVKSSSEQENESGGGQNDHTTTRRSLRLRDKSEQAVKEHESVNRTVNKESKNNEMSSPQNKRRKKLEQKITDSSDLKTSDDKEVKTDVKEQEREVESDVAATKEEKSLEEPPLNEEIVNSSLQWTEKYAPIDHDSILGNKYELSKLFEWLCSWKERHESIVRRLTLLASKGMKRSRAKGADSDTSDSEFDDSDDEDDLCNTYLLTGEVGCGKTAAVYACAQELGFKVLELNPSTCRSGKQIASLLGEATQSHQVKRKFHGESSNNQVEDEDPAKGMKSLASFFGSKAQKGDNGASVDTKGRCPDPSFVKSDIEPLQVKKDEDRTVIADSMSVILLEQVDVVYEELDKGFWQAVNELRTQAKRPIILTSNDRSVAKLLEGGFVEILHMRYPSMDDIFINLQLICLTEQVYAPQTFIKKLVIACDHDVRKCVTLLEFWTEHWKDPFYKSYGKHKSIAKKLNSVKRSICNEAEMRNVKIETDKQKKISDGKTVDGQPVQFNQDTAAPIKIDRNDCDSSVAEQEDMKTEQIGSSEAVAQQLNVSDSPNEEDKSIHTEPVNVEIFKEETAGKKFADMRETLIDLEKIDVQETANRYCKKPLSYYTCMSRLSKPDSQNITDLEMMAASADERSQVNIQTIFNYDCHDMVENFWWKGKSLDGLLDELPVDEKSAPCNLSRDLHLSLEKSATGICDRLGRRCLSEEDGKALLKDPCAETISSKRSKFQDVEKHMHMSMRLDHRAFALDGLPAMKAICSSEEKRKLVQTRRTRRFLHYFDGIYLHMEPELMDSLTKLTLSSE